MVAISLYRGNLHRVPEMPRRWLMPYPKISLKDFKTLLNRRNRALSRLRSPNITTSNPNLNSKQQLLPLHPAAPDLKTQIDYNKTSSGKEEEGVIKNQEINDQGKSEGGDCTVKSVTEAEVAPEKVVDTAVTNEKLRYSDFVEKPAEPANPNLQTSKKVEELDEKEKRKREVENRLQTLNAKKHNLVLALKQILNAEELKRRNCMQGMVARPAGQLQVDTTNDAGFSTRQTTARMGSEANLGGDMEGAEAEDVSNQNTHCRHMFRMSSMSPSSESPLRRTTYFQHNVVPHPSRASIGVTGSPSCFVSISHQGNPGNLPAISVSGTNYVASSPSPAASGGTSVFRDARQPSPWN
ncbi:uncharacterized protein LOC123204576 [Mangifera indica]|uniref:uncharacterized protein LOC123204576 n=1 Tax=Mangifera indica TaxID=29780 RepID=UPI001CFB6B7C|nr:uncharacterized protein LOC123204576 [Mangifera indica]